LGYDAALLSLGALPDASIAELIEHSRAVSSIIPIIGFYLQPSAGGRVLPHDFWREFCQIENVVAIKVAPFNRYQTLEVIRAFAGSGRTREIALYTGNDDNILIDLLLPTISTASASVLRAVYWATGRCGRRRRSRTLPPRSSIRMIFHPIY